MIHVFAVFTGKLLETLQNSSFHKTLHLEAKTNVLHNFAMSRYSYFIFYNFVLINFFPVFTGKLPETLQISSCHQTLCLEAKTNVLQNFAMSL